MINLHNYLQSFRTSSSLEPLKSTIDTGAVSDTTMQLVEEQTEGSFQSISDAQKTINIGHDLSLVLINGMYSKPSIVIVSTQLLCHVSLCHHDFLTLHSAVLCFTSH